MDYKIISVTGTKGKTSVVRAIDAVISNYVKELLRVDTEGAWLNGKQKYTHQDSKRIWGLAPGNAPGRFLAVFSRKPEPKAAVLETNLFCSGPCGLGYNAHDVGIFTNVYAEHTGSHKRLKTEKDIAVAKNFIFSRIAKNGYAVFNADNKHVVSQLSKIPNSKKVTKIACSTKGAPNAIPSDMQIFIEKGEIMLSGGRKKTSLGNLDSYKLYVPGFEPSASNILLILGGLIGYFKSQVDARAIKKLKHYLPSEEQGRLVVFESRRGVKVIFDFAHERESLRSVARLGRALSPQGKIIGVLRLSPTKTEGLINNIAEGIASSFDHFVIYDKIDGTIRKPDKSLAPFRKEKVGYISKLFSESLKKAGANHVDRVIDEEKALNKAVAIAKKGDTIVFIQGNDSATSLDILRKSFEGRLKRIH